MTTWAKRRYFPPEAWKCHANSYMAECICVGCVRCEECSMVFALHFDDFIVCTLLTPAVGKSIVHKLTIATWTVYNHSKWVSGLVSVKVFRVGSTPQYSTQHKGWTTDLEFIRTLSDFLRFQRYFVDFAGLSQNFRDFSRLFESFLVFLRHFASSEPKPEPQPDTEV